MTLPATAFERTPWRIRDVLGVLAIKWAIMFAAFVTLTVIFLRTHHAQLQTLSRAALGARLLDAFKASPTFEWMLVFQLIVFSFLLWALVFSERQVTWRTFVVPGQAASDVRTALRYLGWCVLAACGVTVVVGLAVVLAALVIQQSPEGVLEAYGTQLREEQKIVMPAGPSAWRMLLAIGFVPLVEELVYRGCLYRAFRTRWSPLIANVVSSAIFALSHSYVVALPHIVVIGLFSAIAYERTRSLRSAVVFHMCWNALACAVQQPWLWLLLIPSWVGLYVWSRAAVGAVRPTMSLPHRHHRRGWLIYAWCLLIIVALSYLSAPSTLWELPLMLPMLAAMFLYAAQRRWASPAFWKCYGLLWMLWMGYDLWQAARPASVAELVNEAGVGPTVPNTVLLWISGVACLIGIAVILPAAIVLWRLATREPQTAPGGPSNIAMDRTQAPPGDDAKVLEIEAGFNLNS